MSSESAGATVTNMGSRPTPFDADGGFASVAAGDPSRIGKYQLVKLLGKGGMGAVHQAYDTLLERDVAIKVMLPAIAEDPELKQRFEREARAVARLMHPNVVTVFDLGYHTDGSPYIVMELLRGRDLVDIMRHGPPLSLERKVSIVLQVLDGLGHAHKLGIVHRDIKPANAFVTEDGSVKIMDFGIARFMSAGGTGTGTVIGTASYMSPEQVRGDRVDGRSDLFSVGTLLFELLAGRRPFDADTPVATLFRIANGEPDLALPPGPEHACFEPVLRRALARNPEARYATAADFAGALHSLVDRRTELPEATPPPTIVPARRADPRELFRLLREIHVMGKSGQLHLTVARQRKSLRILKGQIVHGTSDATGEHLGDILVQRGLLAQADLERAVQVVLGERKRLGAVLVERGLLDRARLEGAIGLHAQTILFSAIDGVEASFAFEELSEDLLETDLVCPLSTGQAILDATRRLVDPDLVRSVLGDTSRVLKLSTNPRLHTQKITLTSADGFVLSRIDGTLSARDIVGLIPLPAEDTERSLFSLLCTGIVDYDAEGSAKRSPRESARQAAVRGDTATAPCTARAPRPEPTPAGPVTRPVTRPVPAPPAPAAQPPAGGIASRSTEEIRHLILETHGNLKRDHFEVLGIERTATEDDVKEAYARLARVLHPDVRHDPALDDLREQRREAFIRVSHACETLRSPGDRARYEQAIAPRRFRPAPGSAMPVPTPTPVPTPIPVPTPKTEPTATPPPPPVASTPAPPPSAPPAPDAPAEARIDPRLEPEHILAIAQELYASEMYWDAIQQLEPLIRRVGDPMQTEARMLLALAYLKNPLWKRRAEGVLQSVVTTNPEHVPALLLLAQIYTAGRMLSRAKGLYLRVLELSPRNRQALRSLAVLETPAAAPSAGSLRRLLKAR